MSPAAHGFCVRVRGLAADVVRGDQEVVEALLLGHNGVERVLALEGRVALLEVGLDLVLDDAEGVVLVEVQVAPNKVGNVRRHIVGGVVCRQLFGPVHLCGRAHLEGRGGARWAQGEGGAAASGCASAARAHRCRARPPVQQA